MVRFIAAGPRAGQSFRCGHHRIIRGELLLSAQDAERAERYLARFSVYPEGKVPEGLPEPSERHETNEERSQSRHDISGRPLDPDARAEHDSKAANPIQDAKDAERAHIESLNREKGIANADLTVVDGGKAPASPPDLTVVDGGASTGDSGKTEDDSGS